MTLSLLAPLQSIRTIVLIRPKGKADSEALSSSSMGHLRYGGES